MPEPATSIPLILATLVSGLAFVIAARHARVPDDQRPPVLPLNLMLGCIALLCIGVFSFRIVFVHGRQWVPVQYHVDGLLLISMILSVAILYTQLRPRLFGLSLFALPLLTLMLAWGVCASLWTYRPFNLDSFQPVWTVFHTLATYLGLLGCGVGAAVGAMYLFVQGRLKSKAGLVKVNPMASLETLEVLILRAATLGFVFLTLSLISGLIMVTNSDAATSLGSAWWVSPKVLLAAAAWVVYAVLMNVRSFSTMRGRRAAWLAIAGLFLVLATYGAVEAIDRTETPKDIVPADPAIQKQEAD